MLPKPVLQPPVTARCRDLAAVVDQRVFVSQADSGAVGPSVGLAAGGRRPSTWPRYSSTRDRAPVQIGFVVEDNVDVRITEEGIAPYCAGAWNDSSVVVRG